MSENFTKFVLRRGVEKDRNEVIYSVGEPLYISDYKRLFIGDGINYGGILASNRFLGFANFNLYTNSSGIISAYAGDTVFDMTTNNLYALTGGTSLNIASYAKITRNFTADNVTTILNGNSGISVKTLALDATYLQDNMFGRGLEKDPSYPNKIRFSEPYQNGGLDFSIDDRLKIADRGVTNEKLADMLGNHVKGNIGTNGPVEDISLEDLADVLTPLLIYKNQQFGVPMGTIIDFAGEYPPEGYLSCNGQTFSASEYPELYNVIGNIWGGTYPLFTLPDLRRKTTIGSGGTSTTTIENYVGAVGGTENVILKKENIPSHLHSFNAVIDGGTLSLSPDSGGLRYGEGITSDGTLDGLNAGPLGQPANIIQPSAVVMKCIRAY
jgi:hypothetical protein